MAKYNLGVIGNSRTSSVISFGKKRKQEIYPSESISQVDGSASLAVRSSAAAAHRKRDSKAATKSSKALSEISRSTNGRFEAKYKIGEKTASGACVKEVIESDW
jgi:hypothetical protein